MHISKQQAMKTVTEISTIIQQNVNIMDQNGIIIGSTDSSRLGTFHEGAKQIIDKRLEMLVINSSSEYTGSCPGINLPILFQEEIVGVVGVTGASEEVMRYGKIIKKMTEIMLWANYMKEQQNLNQMLKTRFLEDWILGNASKITPEFISRGLSFGLDITGKHRTMILSVANINEYKSTDDQRKLEKIYRELSLLLEKRTNLLLQVNSCLVCILGELTNQQLLEIVQGLLQQITALFPADPLIIGIDSEPESYLMIHSSYQKALKALRACNVLKNRSFQFYDEINVEMFTEEIPNSLKKEYLENIFRHCTQKEITEWVTLLHTYFQYNGSIGKTAQTLFVHKNTVQYQLNKLKRKTGYDPRMLKDVPVLFFALLFYDELGDSTP